MCNTAALMVPPLTGVKREQNQNQPHNGYTTSTGLVLLLPPHQKWWEMEDRKSQINNSRLGVR